MIVYNEESDDIVKEKHICYYSRRSRESWDKIDLYEVYEKTLKHPAAKEYAFVIKTDIRRVETYNRLSVEAAPTLILEMAEDNMLIHQMEKS